MVVPGGFDFVVGIVADMNGRFHQDSFVEFDRFHGSSSIIFLGTIIRGGKTRSNACLSLWLIFLDDAAAAGILSDCIVDIQ